MEVNWMASLTLQAAQVKTIELPVAGALRKHSKSLINMHLCLCMNRLHGLELVIAKHLRILTDALVDRAKATAGDIDCRRISLRPSSRSYRRSGAAYTC